MATRLPAERKVQLQALLRAGMPTAGIIAAGFVSSTIVRERRSLGLPPMYPKMTAEQRAEVLRLRTENNLATPAIARRLGLSAPAIYSLLRGAPKYARPTRVRVTYTEADEEAILRLYPTTATRAEIEVAVPDHKWESIQNFATNILKVHRPGAALARVHRMIHPFFEILRSAREEQQVLRKNLPEFPNLSAWERGVSMPPVDEFVRWAETFGFTVTLTKQPGTYAEPDRVEPLIVERAAAAPIPNLDVPGDAEGRIAGSIPATGAKTKDELAIAEFLATRGATVCPPVGDPAVVELPPLRWDARKRKMTRAPAAANDADLPASRRSTFGTGRNHFVKSKGSHYVG